MFMSVHELQAKMIVPQGYNRLLALGLLDLGKPRHAIGKQEREGGDDARPELKLREVAGEVEEDASAAVQYHHDHHRPQKRLPRLHILDLQKPRQQYTHEYVQYTKRPRCITSAVRVSAREGE